MNFFLLSCKKATELVEKRNVKSLCLMEQLQFKMHVSMCAACCAYEKQSIAIDKAIASIIKSEVKGSYTLSNETKSEIISKIK